MFQYNGDIQKWQLTNKEKRIFLIKQFNIYCDTQAARCWENKYAAASVRGALHLPLDKERLHKLTENYVVSNRKIKSALGIEKMPLSAHEGIRKTLENFKKS